MKNITFKKYIRQMFKEVFLSREAIYFYAVMLIIASLVPVIFIVLRAKEEIDLKTTYENRQEYLRLRTAESENMSEINEQFVTDSLTELFGNDWLLQESTKEWVYEMKINGEVFKGNAIIVQDPTVTVEISQTEQTSKFTSEIHNRGNVSYSDVGRTFKDYAAFSKPAGVTQSVTETQDGNKITVTYTFSNLQSKERINYTFTGAFASRLGVRANVIIERE